MIAFRVKRASGPPIHYVQGKPFDARGKPALRNGMLERVGCGVCRDFVSRFAKGNTDKFARNFGHATAKAKAAAKLQTG